MKSADALAGFALSRHMLRWMVDNEVMEPPEALAILRATLRDLEHGRTDALIEARRAQDAAGEPGKVDRAKQRKLLTQLAAQMVG